MAQNRTKNGMSDSTTGSTSGKVPKKNPAKAIQRHSAHWESAQNKTKIKQKINTQLKCEITLKLEIDN